MKILPVRTEDRFMLAGRDMRRMDFPTDLAKKMIAEGGSYSAIWEEHGVRKPLRVIASSDDTVRGRLLHISFSYPDRLPNWETVKAVREAFFPMDVDVMLVLPKEADYVNCHPYTHHLWQTPGHWGIR